MPEFSRDVHFSRLIQDQIDQVDLATVALEIARDEYPELDISDWRGRLDRMGVQVRERVSSGEAPTVLIRHVNQFLFVEEGYRGNRGEYYDPRNSFLNDVIERKLGIPITLSLIYLAVADRVGLRLQGVGMPAHFILKFQQPGCEVFIDPFHCGEILTREACELRVSQVVGMPVTLEPEQLEPAPFGQVVLRLLGNLKGIYLKQEDCVRALRVQERIFALNRSASSELRDLGVLYLRNDRPSKAIELLENYLEIEPAADDKETVQTIIKAARRLHTSMN